MARKKIPAKVKYEIDTYLKALRREKLPIEKVIIYGSYAKGAQTKSSDIDLCILSKNFTQPMRAMQYLWSKRNTNHTIRIEPVGFHPKDFQDDSYDSLIQQIRMTGIEYKR